MRVLGVDYAAGRLRGIGIKFEHKIMTWFSGVDAVGAEGATGPQPVAAGGSSSDFDELHPIELVPR